MAASEGLSRLRAALLEGQVIPAHPLALTAERRLDERRQVALTRYYCDAGAGGVAVGVHTTQFAIRSAGLLEPVLRLAAGVVREREAAIGRRLAEGGGRRRTRPPRPSPRPASPADLGYDARAAEPRARCGRPRPTSSWPTAGRSAEVLPLVRLLPPARGGRPGPRRGLLAPVPRDRPGRGHQGGALQPLPHPRRRPRPRRERPRRRRSPSTPATTTRSWPTCSPASSPRGARARSASPGASSASGRSGRAGRWSFSRRSRSAGGRGQGAFDLLALGQQLTDANAALFDARHGFAGCIAGIHEVLRRQGLLAGRWCLDPREDLSPGQEDEIERVLQAYPHLTDDEFVSENLGRWLS